ncbi:MAG: hypothetical protein ACRKFN_11485 [Desulfitobacterium sp.]
MNDLKYQSIETAKQMRESLGGTIFAFPTEPDNPFSPYAVVVYAADQYFVYPEATNISEAAQGVLTILEEYKKRGIDADYERNVRMVSYQAQIDAPDVTMRRLKKENRSKPFFEKSKDIAEGNEEGEAFSARGVIKMSYLSMVDDQNPKAAQFMNEYYKLLAMRKYGKTAAAIKQEVHRMGKDQAARWIEQTYGKYIKDDFEVMDLFNRLG